MRFTISREKLQEGLVAVGPSIPGKTTLPVLANILVETTERRERTWILPSAPKSVRM
jgi:DNA polymerase-3 subunit beta